MFFAPNIEVQRIQLSVIELVMHIVSAIYLADATDDNQWLFSPRVYEFSNKIYLVNILFEII